MMNATDTPPVTDPDAATEGATEPRDPAPPVERRGGRRFGLPALVFILIAGLLIGASAGALLMRPGHPGDTSPEAGFARDMQPHHAQAVEMAMIVHERGTSESVRQLAYDIALSQQTEIGRMRQWLREWDLRPTGTEPPMAWIPGGADMVAADGLMPGMATAEEMTRLREADGIEVDQLFLDLMITHHLGGLHMIEEILALSDHPEVTWLAEAQKEVHHAELQVLRDLQDRVGSP